jgi:hypothetical protein
VNECRLITAQPDESTTQTTAYIKRKPTFSSIGREDSIEFVMSAFCVGWNDLRRVMSRRDVRTATRAHCRRMCRYEQCCGGRMLLLSEGFGAVKGGLLQWRERVGAVSGGCTVSTRLSRGCWWNASVDGRGNEGSSFRLGKATLLTNKHNGNSNNNFGARFNGNSSLLQNMLRKDHGRTVGVEEPHTHTGKTILC